MSFSTLAAGVSSQLWAIAEAYTSFGSYKLEKRKVVNEAISSMRKALNRTRMFLRNGDFSDNSELTIISDLWNTASEKVGVVDARLGMILGDKSRFWSDHELFVRLGRDKEVMTLNEVVSEIDKMYNKLK